MEILYLKNTINDISELKNSPYDFLSFSNILDNYKNYFKINNNKLNKLFDILSKDNMVYNDNLKSLLDSIKNFILIDLKKKYIDNKLTIELNKDIYLYENSFEKFKNEKRKEKWFEIFDLIYDIDISLEANLNKFLNIKLNYNNYIIPILVDDNNTLEESEEINIKSNKRITKYDITIMEFKDILSNISKLIEKLDKNENKSEAIGLLFENIDDLDIKIDKIINDSKNYKIVIKKLKSKMNELKNENQKIQFLIRRESLNNEQEVKCLRLKNQIQSSMNENSNLSFQVDNFKDENIKLLQTIKTKNTTIENLTASNNQLKNNMNNWKIEIWNLKNNFEKVINEKNKENKISEEIKLRSNSIDSKLNEIETLKVKNNELNISILNLNGQIIKQNNTIIRYENELSCMNNLNSDDVKSKKESIILELNNDYLSLSNNTNLINYLFTDFCFIFNLNKNLELFTIKVLEDEIIFTEFSNKKYKIIKKIKINKIKEVFFIINENLIEFELEYNNKFSFYIFKIKEFLKILNLDSINKSIINNKYSVFSNFNNCKFIDIILINFGKGYLLNLIVVYEDHFILFNLKFNIFNINEKKWYFSKELNSKLDEVNDQIIIKINKKKTILKHLNQNQLIKLFESINN